LPIILRARELRARPDLEAIAEGDVDFRIGGTRIDADRLSYDQSDDLAVARGGVRITRPGAVYSGPEVQLHVQRFEGFFLQPDYEFTQLGAGGHADRIDFIDSARSVATNASYTSCPRDGSGDPAWILQTQRLKLDLDTDEGIAEGAVLRFLGKPILALPEVSFPLSDARRSGWLPPTVVPVDSRSGLTVSMPYYWNIAPNRDLTVEPRLSLRRGFAADTEFRYLEPGYSGRLDLNLLPNDRVAGRARGALHWQQDARLPQGLRFSANVARVSDDGWWQDFPDAGRSPTPRLLSQRVALERPFGLAGGEGLVYAREQRWQALQGSDQLVTPPYQRSPQLGVQLHGRLAQGFRYRFETELNHFTLPDANPDPSLPTGYRVHALGSLSRPLHEPGWWAVPKVSFNGASYRVDEPGSTFRRNVSRLIPTFSVDGGLQFERKAHVFGRDLRQTLEPRVMFVETPYVNQTGLPDFDAAAKDFDLSSIYSENSFSGIDRVSDARQITAGVTSRFIDEKTGAEAMRLGVAQRYLLRQQLTAPKSDGTPDGPPLQRHFSDLLLFGSSTMQPRWTLDGSLEYSPDLSRPVRTVAGLRYSPGPFRTLSLTYRLARGLNEQVELGWQWPLRFTLPDTRGPAATVGEALRRHSGGSSCSGTWYAVGHVNYSMFDSRMTDSLIGAEYDAGCWIGRVVAERVSTGTSTATTRLMLQLELVGLSRLGSNPLQVLKDNIPGYRLLRESRSAPTLSDE
ncbi:MAG: LPS-assembly protein LptD, partial [Burkholderiales bacterium]|nr:LPS-assembly protein LptD [Burkholderiales bacterium]